MKKKDMAKKMMKGNAKQKGRGSLDPVHVSKQINMNLEGKNEQENA